MLVRISFWMLVEHDSMFLIGCFKYFFYSFYENIHHLMLEPRMYCQINKVQKDLSCSCICQSDLCGIGWDGSEWTGCSRLNLICQLIPTEQPYFVRNEPRYIWVYTHGPILTKMETRISEVRDVVQLRCHTIYIVTILLITSMRRWKTYGISFEVGHVLRDMES